MLYSAFVKNSVPRTETYVPSSFVVSLAPQTNKPVPPAPVYSNKPLLLRTLILLFKVLNPNPISIVMNILYHPSPRGIDPCEETVIPLVAKRLPTTPVSRFTVKCAFSTPESKRSVNLSLSFSPFFAKNEDVNV